MTLNIGESNISKIKRKWLPLFLQPPKSRYYFAPKIVFLKIFFKRNLERHLDLRDCCCVFWASIFAYGCWIIVLAVKTNVHGFSMNVSQRSNLSVHIIYKRNKSFFCNHYKYYCIDLLTVSYWLNNFSSCNAIHRHTHTYTKQCHSGHSKY